MDGRKDFTIDSVNFGDLADYFRELRQNHSMKTIIILVSKPWSFLVFWKGFHCRNKFYSKTVNNDKWFTANWRLQLHIHVLSWAFDGMMGITRCWHNNIVISCILDIWSLLRMAVYSGIGLTETSRAITLFGKSGRQTWDPRTDSQLFEQLRYHDSVIKSNTVIIKTYLTLPTAFSTMRLISSILWQSPKTTYLIQFRFVNTGSSVEYRVRLSHLPWR